MLFSSSGEAGAHSAEASELVSGAVNTHTQSPATPLPAFNSHILALESVKTLGKFRSLTWRLKREGGRSKKDLVWTQPGWELHPPHCTLTMPWPHQRALLTKLVATVQAGIPGAASVMVSHVIPHCPCTVTERGQEQDPACSQQTDPSQQYPGRAAQGWDNLVKSNPVSSCCISHLGRQTWSTAMLTAQGA